MATLRLLFMCLTVVQFLMTALTNSSEMFPHFSSNFQIKKTNLNGVDFKFVVFHVSLLKFKMS